MQSNILVSDAVTIARGLTWDPRTGIALAGKRSGGIQDPSIDPYAAPKGTFYGNIANRNRSYYARFIGMAQSLNYILHTHRFALEFDVPEEIIDTTRFRITAVRVKLFCAQRLLNGSGTAPNSTLQCFEMPSSFENKEPAAIYAEIAGTPLASSIVTGTGWFSFNLPTDYLSDKLGDKLILGFKDAAESDYSDLTEDVAMPGYEPVQITDPPIIVRAFDFNNYVHSRFTIDDGEPQNKACIEVEYEVREEPGSVLGFIKGARHKYANSLDGKVRVSDPESQNQSLLLEGSFATPSGSFGGFIPLGSVNISAPPPSGEWFDWSVSLPSGIVSGENLLWSQEKWVYDQPQHVENATFDGQWIFSGVGEVSVDVPSGFLPLNYAFGGDLTNCEVFLGSTHGNEIQVSENGSFSIGVRSFGPATASGLYLRIDGASAKDYYLNTKVRATCVEAGISGNTFEAPFTYFVDNKIPESVVVTEANTQNEVWQGTTPSGSFSWNEVEASGYLYAIGAVKNPVLTPNNSQFTQNTEINTVLPFNGAWYFSVAPISDNGIVGNASSYGFFYNNPVDFVTASGIKVNGGQVDLGANPWVPSSSNAAIGWVAPSGQIGKVYSYDLVVGTKGAVTGKEFEWDIDWSLVPSGESAFFKTTIRDHAGVKYTSRSTDTPASGWSYFDADWVTASGIFAIPYSGASKIKYTLQNEDATPANTSLHAYLQTGWFDVDGGGVINYSPELSSVSCYFGNIGLQNAVFTGFAQPDSSLQAKLKIEASGMVPLNFYSVVNPVGFEVRPSGAQSWANFAADPISGIYEYRFNLEPYMGIPLDKEVSVSYKTIIDGVEPSGWQLVGSFTLGNPDKDLEWNIYEPQINASGVNSNQYISGIKLAESTNYFAKMRVFDSMQYSEWTPPFKFRVNTPPKAPKGLRIL